MWKIWRLILGFYRYSVICNYRLLNYFLLMIYEINHIWTAEMKWRWRNDRRSERNLCNCVKKPEKKFFHGNIWTHNWPAPNISGFIAQLVEHRTGITRSQVQTPLKSWIFFFQASLRNCINCVHCDDRFFIFISFLQFIYDLFHIYRN